MYKVLLGAVAIAGLIGIGTVGFFESRVQYGEVQPASGDTLVVLLHGYALDKESLNAVRDSMRKLHDVIVM